MGAVDTTYTFTANDTITSTKMNNIIDQTTITSDAIIGNTLEVTSGKLRVRSANITSNELAANSVTTNAITDLNVTTGKIADSNVTTVKIADASVTPAKLSQKITRGSSQNATGTSIDFTSIPSWAVKITVMLSNVSTNGTSLPIIQIGDSGGFETTGYNGYYYLTPTVRGVTSSGVVVNGLQASGSSVYGQIVLLLIDAANTWSFCSTNVDATSALGSTQTAGSKQLSATLDRVRLTTVNGSDTFDTGVINIIYE